MTITATVDDFAQFADTEDEVVNNPTPKGGGFAVIRQPWLD